MREKLFFNTSGSGSGLACTQVQPHLGALADGELASQDEAVLRVHVGSCLECSRELKSLEGADRIVRAGEKQEPSEEVLQRVLDELRRDGRIRDDGTPARGGGSARVRVVLVLVCLSAILVIVLAVAGLVWPSVGAGAAAAAGVGYLGWRHAKRRAA